MNEKSEKDNRMEQKKLYVNRELSWLDFNKRVLEEAENPQVPLYERLKFVSIFANNLDEFFMVRVGSLYDQTLLKEPVYDSKTGMSSQEQLDAIFEKVRGLMPQRDAAYFDIIHQMKEKGFRQVDFRDMSAEEEAYFAAYFEKQVQPLLSPQIIDKTHPFPFFENKKLFIAVILSASDKAEKEGGKGKMGLVPVEGFLDRTIYVKEGDGFAFALMEDLLMHFADRIFEGMKVQSRMVMRVTRNADIDVDDNMVDTDLDYREAMEELLKKRRKLVPVRLELSHQLPDNMLRNVCEKLSIKPTQVFVNQSPLDMSFGFAMESKIKDSSMFFRPLRPQRHPQIREDVPMADQILKHDILLHYPYQDIKPLLRLLDEAAEDPKVVSIKISLYRVAGDSKIISALVRAAENGKDVSVVVELKARFDEMNNIDWSKLLEEAGCHVVYGLDGYKVHSKLMLIVRRSAGGIQYISHVGTGNFNEKTAKVYTDLALLTSNKEIGSEVSAVFNDLFMGQTTDDTTHLLVAPHSFKNKIVTLFDREIALARSGEPAEIMLKMNSLTDKTLINKLVEASCAGVKIRMIVRGICCLRAGIPGKTENIEVISIVGRFLEHSRIYVFGVGKRRRVYISSADFMTRNTERRVEVGVPIYDPEISCRLLEILDVMFRDNVKARHMLADGTFAVQKDGKPPLNAQEYFYKLAYEQAARVVPQQTHKVERKKAPEGNWLSKLFKNKKK